MTMLTARDNDRYPSRTSSTPSLTPRPDPVVHPGREGPLGPDALRRFDDDGFMVFESLIDEDEVAALNRELDRLAADPDQKQCPESVIEPDGGELRSVFAIHHHESPLGRLTRDPRLVAVARQLLGDDVYLHQTRANLKPAFRGKEFYWHSDFETWHTEDGMPTPRAVSCSIQLTENHPWNGPLLTIAGSHKWYVSCVGETPEDHYQESLRRQEIGTPDDESLVELARKGQITQCLGPVGTAVFFDSNIMHGSNSNITPYPRRNVFMVYNSVSNALEDPFAAPAPRPEFIASRTFDPV